MNSRPKILEWRTRAECAFGIRTLMSWGGSIIASHMGSVEFQGPYTIPRECLWRWVVVRLFRWLIYYSWGVDSGRFMLKAFWIIFMKNRPVTELQPERFVGVLLPYWRGLLSNDIGAAYAGSHVLVRSSVIVKITQGVVVVVVVKESEQFPSNLCKWHELDKTLCTRERTTRNGIPVRLICINLW